MKRCLFLLAALLTLALPSTALAGPEPLPDGLSQADLAYLKAMIPITRAAADAASGIGETATGIGDGSLTLSRGIARLRTHRAALQQAYDDWEHVQPSSRFADTDALFGKSLETFLASTDLVIEGASYKDAAAVQRGAQGMLEANRYLQQWSAALTTALGPVRSA
jgi:hypothetical protein